MTDYFCSECGGAIDKITLVNGTILCWKCWDDSKK